MRQTEDCISCLYYYNGFLRITKGSKLVNSISTVSSGETKNQKKEQKRWFHQMGKKTSHHDLLQPRGKGLEQIFPTTSCDTKLQKMRSQACSSHFKLVSTSENTCTWTSVNLGNTHFSTTSATECLKSLNS